MVIPVSYSTHIKPHLSVVIINQDQSACQIFIYTMDHATCFPEDPTENPRSPTSTQEESITDASKLENISPRHVAQILDVLRKSGGGGEPGDDGYGAGMPIEAEDGEEDDEIMAIPDTVWHI